jgi:asparagine synthase (glutamine-hydrolysing)
MFAFAVLDTQERRLLLARDFFGIKPLYYGFTEGRFAFASELKALLAVPGIGRTINPTRLYRYLREGTADDGGETMLADIHQLPAGHYLEMSIDSVAGRPVRYWSVELAARSSMPFPEAAAGFRDLFLESVDRHLRSDVPVGVALSGGLDSSSILMATQSGGGKSNRVHAFSYVADDAAISEERWIDLVGEASGVPLHKFRIRPEELVRDLDHLIAVQDEPFLDTRIYAQYCVFRSAHEAGMKVILDGQGADELLGGYGSHVAARLGALVRRGLLLGAIPFAIRSARRRDVGVRGLALGALKAMAPGYADRLGRWYGADRFPSSLNAEWFRERGVAPRAEASRLTGGGHPDEATPFKDALRRSLVETILPSLLRYGDRSAMAFSLENRVPFLTPRLASFVLSQPDDYLIAPDGASKALLREAMRGIVPAAVLARRNKIAFLTTERDWLVAVRPWIGATLEGEAAAQVVPLDRTATLREWTLIAQGRRPYDSRVWRWVNLIKWIEHVGGRFD